MLIGTMFFRILGCALLTLPSGDDALRGFVPSRAFGAMVRNLRVTFKVSSLACQP